MGLDARTRCHGSETARRNKLPRVILEPAAHTPCYLRASAEVGRSSTWLSHHGPLLPRNNSPATRLCYSTCVGLSMFCCGKKLPFFVSDYYVTELTLSVYRYNCELASTLQARRQVDVQGWFCPNEEGPLVHPVFSGVNQLHIKIIKYPSEDQFHFGIGKVLPNAISRSYTKGL